MLDLAVRLKKERAARGANPPLLKGKIAAKSSITMATRC